MLSLSVHIYPTDHQRICLETLSNEHRLLYNRLLEAAKTGANFKELIELHKQFRKENNLTIHSHVAQMTCHTLIESIKSFYALKKRDATARFPYRFKSWKQFQTIRYHWNGGSGGFKFDDENTLSLTLDRKHRVTFRLPDYIKTKGCGPQSVKQLTVRRDDVKNCYVFSFVYQEEPKNSSGSFDKDKFLSIDLGISQIATAFSNSVQNFSIQNSRFKKVERRKEHVQSLRDKKKKGSRRHKKLTKTHQRLCRKLSDKNKDFQHKVSKKIVDHCTANDIGTMIVGDIKTKKLPKGSRSSSGLNKSTQNQGTLSRFKTFLSYKAKNAGMDFHLVNESYTSQLNCLTGQRSLSSDLSVREVEISEGVKIDRDLNAATNIAKRIMGEWFTHTQNLMDYLSGFEKMYVDNSSVMRPIVGV